ncbi:hypothetical protein IU427_16590 [Nocardia beijingensis]|uniref:hypothetical protein n=1 Tax=Nocardia beijingensis TaxID=95162 RepID=UPI001894C922|nr:hypothetical protein [Nocardia beijingensis]MBF6466786.1 hypothetical protein [Nocardia beijingensis]
MGTRRRELVAAARQAEADLGDPQARSRLDRTEMVRFCGRVHCGESSSHALAVHAIRARRTIGIIGAAATDAPFDRLRLESLQSVAREVEGLDPDTVDLTHADRIAEALTRFFQQRKVSGRRMAGVHLICLNEAYAVAARHRDPYLGARNIADMGLFADPGDERFVALCDELAVRVEESGSHPVIVDRIREAMAEFTRANPV